jgi:hypothetical protein
MEDFDFTPYLEIAIPAVSAITLAVIVALWSKVKALAKATPNPYDDMFVNAVEAGIAKAAAEQRFLDAEEEERRTFDDE